jgi:hypothetical protein
MNRKKGSEEFTTLTGESILSMKRTYKIALSLVLSLGIVAPAFAQDSFPDVQDTHWAADAIKRLKLEKFIQGMPNGNFEGKRAITRYEMASLVYAVYAKLVCYEEEVAVKIKDLEAKINKKSGEMTTPAPSDDSALKAALASLKSDVGTMKAWGSDISMLKKMTGSYSKELTSLGADVTSMKKQLNDLSMRITALEKKTDNVVISGDANLWAFSGNRDSGSATGVNQDGRFVQGTPTGAGVDLGVLHELGLKVSSGASAQRAWGAELVVGNVTAGIGNQSDFAGQLGAAYGNNPASDVYLNTAWAALPEVLNSTVGRQGINLGRYILARPDFTSFYSQERWDNGQYLMDGLKTGTYGFGPVTINAFIGRFGANTSAGTALQPVISNGINPSRILGTQIGFGLGNFAKLTGTYVNLDGDNGPVNRQEIYGVDGDFDFAGLKFTGGYGKSVLKFNSGTINDNNNVRYNVAGTIFGGIKVGYDHVEQNYVAPGDWGRTGLFRNLVNVNRVTADLGYQINDKWHLSGGYANNRAIQGVGETKGWNVGLKTALTPKWDMMLTHENTQFDGGFQNLPNGTFARFSTIWLDYDAGSSSLLKLFYQMGESSNPLGGGPKGGFFGMQYGIKF